MEEVGVEQNFFELGGHSLLVLQVMARIRRRFGLEMPVRTVFEGPTIAGLATAVEAAEAGVEGADPDSGTATPSGARRYHQPRGAPRTTRQAIGRRRANLTQACDGWNFVPGSCSRAAIAISSRRLEEDAPLEQQEQEFRFSSVTPRRN